MTSRVATIAFQGVEGVLIDCQAQFVNGQTVFNVVGLPDKAVGESRERNGPQGTGLAAVLATRGGAIGVDPQGTEGDLTADYADYTDRNSYPRQSA